MIDVVENMQAAKGQIEASREQMVELVDCLGSLTGVALSAAEVSELINTILPPIRRLIAATELIVPAIDELIRSATQTN